MTADPLNIADSVEEVAADWFALKRSGAMTAAELREFQVWLDQDGAHRAAFDDLERMWLVAAAAATDPELAIREAERRAHPRRLTRAAYAGAVAASLSLAVLGGWAAIRAGLVPDPFARPLEQEFRTGVGQRTTVNLPDGSVVTLDTDTLLRTRESGRRRLVDLEHGQAFFRVAKDPTRPFIVAALGKTVTATGTQFDVRADPERFQVTLVEGKVRVEAPRGQFRPGQAADMLPGWRLTARDGREWTLNQVDLNKETSWLSGRLTLLYDPLENVVAELNRYSDRKIVVRDPAIARKPIVGVVEAGDVDGFVKLVKAYKLARVRETSDGGVELSAP